MLGTATRSEPSCHKLSSVTNRINPNYHMPIVFIPLVEYYPSKVIPIYVLGHIKLGWYEDNWCPKSGKFYAKQKYVCILLSPAPYPFQTKPWQIDFNINLYFYSTLEQDQRYRAWLLVTQFQSVSSTHTLSVNQFQSVSFNLSIVVSKFYSVTVFQSVLTKGMQLNLESVN